MPKRPEIAPGVVRGDFSHVIEGGKRVQCDLCPRYCKLQEGQRGFCFIRQARAGGIDLTSYGRASGFVVDPIEKKPLYHFFPGTSVLSFGTAGCNLGCRFCQNWDISKAREMSRLTERAEPEAIARATADAGCRSLAFTYNDPVIFAEFAEDCAVAAHEHGVKTVAVTAGYISREARAAFFAPMDATNVDLKAFTEGFYEKLCFAALGPVLDTLHWLKRETQVWLEVTTLLIPGKNDSVDEVARLSDWCVEHLGPDTPLHFSAFHPDFKLDDTPATPADTVRRARQQAKQAGLHHVYTGNIRDREGQSTYCSGCGKVLVEREGYRIVSYQLDETGKCRACGVSLAGRFGEPPARPSSYDPLGPRRVRLAIASTP